MNFDADWISPFLGKLATTLLGVGVLFLLRFVVDKVTERNISKEIEMVRWKKWSLTLYYLLCIILVAFIWIDGFQTFATLIALISAGLAIAFKEPLLNMGAWAYILARRPFVIGDRIEVNQVVGEVIDIRLFVFTLQELGGNRIGAEQLTGRIVHVPNAAIFTAPCFNFTESKVYIYHELPVYLTHESNWQKIESHFLAFMANHTKLWEEVLSTTSDNTFRDYYLFDNSRNPCVYVKIERDALVLQLRFPVHPRQVRMVEDAIWRDLILFIRSQDDLEFALIPARVTMTNPSKS